MLINLNFYYYLYLLFIYQIEKYQVDADENENNFNFPFLNSHSLSSHYHPYRFYKSFLTPFTQYENRMDYNKLAKRNDLMFKVNLNPTLHKKEVIELNNLEDNEPIYTSYSAKTDNLNEDDKELIKLKEHDNFEYSNGIDNEILISRAITTGNEIPYDDQEHWPGQCTDQNARQSPIALDEFNSRLDFRTQVDIGINYAKKIAMVELENKGNTVEFGIPKDIQDLIITGPALDYKIYKANSIHFHWGSNDSVGSEHVINKERYPLEMHIVNYNIKYVNLNEALNHEDGTVVIAIMFKIGKMNKAIHPIISEFNKIRCKEQKTILKDINVLRLFPTKVRRLYQYYGSLTTPPCTPRVNWIIIETPNTISHEQMKNFRLLTTDTLCQNPNLRNWRNLQDLKNRDVRRSLKL